MVLQPDRGLEPFHQKFFFFFLTRGDSTVFAISERAKIFTELKQKVTIEISQAEKKPPVYKKGDGAGYPFFSSLSTPGKM
jgi:hypothetical protein